MSHLLYIQASVRGAASQSRNLGQQFVESWQVFNPQSNVIERDLAQSPIPHVDATWVTAYETPPEERSPQLQAALALSDQLIDELFWADRYVISVPMYNLTIPSGLKAYLDQVIRRDRTLVWDETGRPYGALQGKKALVITTRKFNYRLGSPGAERNFLEPYLQAILGVIGVTDVTCVVADELAGDEATQGRSLSQAMAQLVALAGRW